MPDSRFFAASPPLALAELLALTGGELVRGDTDRQIDNAAPLVRADGRSVAFLADRRYRADLAATRAGAVIVAPGFAEAAPAAAAVVASSEPQAAWARVAARLHPPRELDQAEAIHPSAELEPDVVLGPGVVLGSGVRIGRGTRIGANAVLGPGVAIGRDSRVGPNASLGFCLIGDGVRIGAGTVIGEPGFGVAPAAGGPVDIPQLGRVILQDRVSVGAGVCIDRGAWDDTVVGEGTKIDNLVQIAHNVRIGRFCLIAAHTGLSGSVVVEDGAMFGGRAGVADHFTIGRGAKVAAAAAVFRDVPAGETWSGYPARPVRQFLREAAWVAKQARSRGGDGDE